MEDEEEALIVAVAALRVRDPDASARQVHSKLVQQEQWASATISAVKRACSKAAKRGLRGSHSSDAADAEHEPTLGPTTASQESAAVQESTRERDVKPTVQSAGSAPTSSHMSKLFAEFAAESPELTDDFASMNRGMQTHGANLSMGNDFFSKTSDVLQCVWSR